MRTVKYYNKMLEKQEGLVGKDGVTEWSVTWQSTTDQRCDRTKGVTGRSVVDQK